MDVADRPAAQRRRVLATDQEIRVLVLLHEHVGAVGAESIWFLDAQGDAAFPVVEFRGTEDDGLLVADTAGHHSLAPVDRPDCELAVVAESANKLESGPTVDVLVIAEVLAGQQVDQ